MASVMSMEYAAGGIIGAIIMYNIIGIYLLLDLSKWEGARICRAIHSMFVS
jgi:hypothetical protein